MSNRSILYITCGGVVALVCILFFVNWKTSITAASENNARETSKIESKCPWCVIPARDHKFKHPGTVIPDTTTAAVPSLFQDALKKLKPIDESVTDHYCAAEAVAEMERIVGWDPVRSDFKDPKLLEPLHSGVGEDICSRGGTVTQRKWNLINKIINTREVALHDLMDVVIPSIRDLDFLENWKPFIQKFHIILIQDGDPTKHLKVPEWADFELYNRNDIENILGDKSWIISQRDASIRNFGFLLSNKKFIWSVDDDCFPATAPDGSKVDALLGHAYNLLTPSTPYFFNTVYDPYDTCVDFVRGYPYSLRGGVQTAVSHGLWMNTYDYDAPTQLLKVHERNSRFADTTQTIPYHILYPLCSMNVAFNRELLGPAVMQGLMGTGTPWGRYDDMFSGWASKVVADHLELGTKSGAPYIHHNKASNPFTNLAKEYMGLEWQEEVIRFFDSVRLSASSDTPAKAYLEVADLIAARLEYLSPYFLKLAEAIRHWVGFWEAHDKGKLPAKPSRLTASCSLDKLYKYPKTKLTLPSSLQKIKVFIYRLPCMFNGNVMDYAENSNVGNSVSNCNWLRGPCAEVTRHDAYSNMRQYAAEVAILYKFMQLSQTENPAEADFIIVPFFGATSKWQNGCPWGAPCPTIKRDIDRLKPHLIHYEKYKQKHVFLDTRDRFDIGLRDFLPDSFVVNYGPRYSTKNDIVVPPNDAGFGLNSSTLPNNGDREPKHFLFFMAGLINDERKIWFKQLETLKTASPQLGLELHTISGHRKFTLTIGEVQALVADSLLCPIPKGDLPYQHRFYDVAVMGCLPVVIARTKNITSGVCTSHFAESTCTENQYPYHKSIPWKDIIVEVPVEIFNSNKLGEFLTNLDKKELYQRRKTLLSHREKLLYDWSGQTQDAFVGLLEELISNK